MERNRSWPDEPLSSNFIFLLLSLISPGLYNLIRAFGWAYHNVPFGWSGLGSVIQDRSGSCYIKGTEVVLTENLSAWSRHSSWACNLVLWYYIITKSMRALWLTNQLWVIVAVNPRKNRASSELLYESNRPQVSMGYRLINHLGCW